MNRIFSSLTGKIHLPHGWSFSKPNKHAIPQMMHWKILLRKSLSLDWMLKVDLKLKSWGISKNSPTMLSQQSKPQQNQPRNLVLNFRITLWEKIKIQAVRKVRVNQVSPLSLLHPKRKVRNNPAMRSKIKWIMSSHPNKTRTPRTIKRMTQNQGKTIDLQLLLRTLKSNQIRANLWRNREVDQNKRERPQWWKRRMSSPNSKQSQSTVLDHDSILKVSRLTLPVLRLSNLNLHRNHRQMRPNLESCSLLRNCLRYSRAWRMKVIWGMDHHKSVHSLKMCANLYSTWSQWKH